MPGISRSQFDGEIARLRTLIDRLDSQLDAHEAWHRDVLRGDAQLGRQSRIALIAIIVSCVSAVAAVVAAVTGVVQ